MININKTKSDLRLFLKSIRESIGQEKREKKDKVISDSLLRYVDDNFSKKTLKIMIYLSFGTEVSTKKIVSELLNRGHFLYVPRVNSKEKRKLDIVTFNKDTKLSKGKYGIMEPVAGDLISPAELDLIILPGLGFDKSLNRLGYGGGYYDNILNKISKKCIKIAICYKEQIVKKIPQEPHDIQVNIIISENSVIE